jgi:hypothetical protein
MSQQLHKLDVAHGDLQGSNIKVVGSGAGIDFQLIDYDTLIVPAAHGRKAEASALPSYQHPKRGASRSYSGKEDYFSELLIYLSLLAVAERPSMWSSYPKGDPGLKDEDRHDKDMLFVKEDFLSERPTAVFKELFALSPLVKNLTLVLWNFSRKPTIEQLLPLEEAVRIARVYVSEPHYAPKTSPFEGLLCSSSGGGSGWLDDSDFVTREQHPPAATQKITAANKTGSFQELLASSRNLSSKDAGAPANGSTITPPQLMSVWQALVVIGIFIVLVALVAVKADKNRFYEYQAAPATQSIGFQDLAAPAKQSGSPSNEDQQTPQQKELALTTNPATPAEPSPTPDEQMNLKSRLAWKTDLQRRQEESDAKFDALAKRFSLGVEVSEVDSFNAEVKAAERLRDELEDEINDFNSGRITPARYYQ